MKSPLLFVALLITTFSSFTSAQNLTFWHYWDGANGQVLQGLIDQYEEANPGVTIEAVFTPGAELTAKLQTAIAGRQTPTMAIADLVAMPLLTSSGALAPLDDYLSASDLDLADYFQGPLVYGMHEGKRYSLPVSASNLGLFWNKELFAQAGLDPNTPPKTWDELVAFSKQIKEATGKWGFELYTQGGEGTSWQWQVYLWQNGGEVLSEDLTTPAFDSEAGQEALQFWVDLIHAEQVSSLEAWGLFGRGEAAMVMDGSWMTQFFPMQVNFELGSAAMPTPEGGEPATNMGGEQIFIFEGDEATKQAAWDFIEWFSSTAVQVEWDKGTGFMPIRASVANDPGYTAWVKNARPLLLPFVETMQVAHARPPIEHYPQVSDTLGKYIVEALYQRMEPAAALTAAASEIEPLLQ
jgi:multiple sugar transport system substrate-binding protein